MAKKAKNIVIASTSPYPAADEQLANQQCQKCHHEFFGPVGFAPFCPRCGSNTPVIVDSMRYTLEDEMRNSEVASYTCTGCTSKTLLSVETAAQYARKGSMHCIQCGTELNFLDKSFLNVGYGYSPSQRAINRPRVAPVSFNRQQVETRANVSSPPNKGYTMAYTTRRSYAAPSVASSVSEYTPPALPKIVPDTVAGSDALYDLRTVIKEKQRAIAKALDTRNKAAQTKSAPARPVKRPNTRAAYDVLDENGGDDFEVDLVNFVEEKVADDPDNVRFFADDEGDSILAFVGNLCVAHLGYDKNAVTATVFASPNHIKSMYKLHERAGMRKTLRDFGFTPIKIKAKVNAALLKDEQDKIQYQMDSELKKYEDDFSQCLSIAAAGLSRGYFKDQGNPLKAGFFEVLASANVRHPEKLINTAFAGAGDAYHRVLFRVAKELMSKTPSVRNELANTIAATDFIAPDIDLDDLEDQIDDNFDNLIADSDDDVEYEIAKKRPSLEDRVERAFKPVGTEREVASAKQFSGSLFSRYKMS